MAWQVDFYVDERGRAPVEEFLAELPTNHRAKALALIKMLEEEGANLPFPYSSQVKGKLRELRAQQGKDRLRILYFGDAKESVHSSSRYGQEKREAARGRHSDRGGKDGVP